MTSLSELVIVASEEPWRRFGLVIDGGVAVTAGVRLRFVAGDQPGIVSWGLDGLPDDELTQIDGLPTHVCPPPADGPRGELDVVGFDHLVVRTADLERTCAAIERSTGAPLKRVREAGETRQGFHRFGAVIIEVVEHRANAAGAATLWGFVLTVADLEATCRRLGEDVVSAARPAVQPGRTIATVRPEAGLGIAVALMSAERRA